MQFQPVQGARDVSIFPYIRKIDLMSSNSYIISSPDQISVIDPGGLEDQLRHLETQVEGLLEDHLRPVVVYLTHAHVDHWIQVQNGGGSFCEHAYLAAQEIGAKALEAQDGRLTLSGLLGRSPSKMEVQIKILSARDESGKGPESTDLNGWQYRFSDDRVEITEGLIARRCTVSLGETDTMEIYHTPGHSPDSICLRVGSLLIVGDLFFAPNPGMAGAYGWNQQDLMQSILKIIWLLESRDIRVCLSGHGRPIDAQTARKTLEVMYMDASSLQGLEEITPLWLKRTVAYAQDLMTELERTFVIIAGRTAYIAHMLSELEEEAEASEMDGMLDAQALDDIFSDFRSFASELHAGRKLDWEMVHKTGQIVGRLDSLFQKKRLGSVLDQSLMNRAGRLLSDYAATYRGFRPPYYVSNIDIRGAVQEILDHLRQNPYDEEAILDAVSQEDYLVALKARIAHVNLFEDVNISFQADLGYPFVRMDKERFCDILMDMLERFAGAGQKDLSIVISRHEDWVLVRIASREAAVYHPLEKASRFLERSLALCGGLLEIRHDEGCPVAEVELFGPCEE